MRALVGHREPALAVLYASAAGAAGIQVAGWIPQRALTSGLVPVPGRARIEEVNVKRGTERPPQASDPSPDMAIQYILSSPAWDLLVALELSGGPGIGQWVTSPDGDFECVIPADDTLEKLRQHLVRARNLLAQQPGGVRLHRGA